MGMWGSNQSKHCHFTKETPEWQAGLEKKHVLLKAVTEKKDKLSRYPQQRVHTLIHRTCCKPLHQELVPDTQFPEALIPPNRPCRTGLTSLESSCNPKPSMGSSPSSRTSEIFNSKPDRPCYLQTSIYRNCTPETSGTSETLQYLWNLRTARPYPVQPLRP